MTRVSFSNIFFLLHGMLNLAIKSPTFTNATRSRLNNKKKLRKNAVGMRERWRFQQTQVQLATVPKAANHVSPLPPMAAIPRRCLCGIVLVCRLWQYDSCWDSWKKSATNQFYGTLTRRLRERLSVCRLIRSSCSWHNGGKTTEGDGRLGNVYFLFCLPPFLAM